jgi:secernin
MLVALSRATRGGGTLFGHNCNRPDGEEVALVREAGRTFAPGENVQVGGRPLPQVRRTYTVLASRRPGQWGYEHGLNEHGVSIGLTSIRTRRMEGPLTLSGSELVRLGLERATSARQAVDVVTDLVSRHGQGSAELERDPALLIADGREAFVVEMFGSHWAAQHVGEVRAVSDVCHLRQDWDHLSPGLANLAIARGWWPADGSKLDFAAVAAPEQAENAASLRRWGRATLLLEQENGQINLPVLHRILSDHVAGFIDSGGASSLCQHGAAPASARTVASLITQSGPGDALPVAWYSFGPPCANVYFPLFPVGELPEDFRMSRGGGVGDPRPARDPHSARDPCSGRDLRPALGSLPRTALAGLQERFDRETREFVTEAAELRQRGESDRLPRLAELFMRHVLECWENVCLEFAPVQTQARRVDAESEYHSSGAWS